MAFNLLVNHFKYYHNKLMLELKNIHKSFGEREILSGVNLKLEKGNVYMLMGANGAGKTTIFNIITNFLKADEGEIFLNGIRIDNLSAVSVSALGITRTFQNLRLIERLSVKENILLAFKENKGEKIWNALLPSIIFQKENTSFEHKATDIIKKGLTRFDNSAIVFCPFAALKATLTLNCALWLRRLFFIILSPRLNNSNIFLGDKYILKMSFFCPVYGAYYRLLVSSDKRRSM